MKRTKVRNDTLNPLWDEQIMWDVPDPKILEDMKIDISCWDKDYVGEDFLGRMTIPLNDALEMEGGLHSWFALLDDARGKVSYKMLGLNWQPDLPSRFSCKEVPHRFGSNPHFVNTLGSYVLPV